MQPRSGSRNVMIVKNESARKSGMVLYGGVEKISIASCLSSEFCSGLLALCL